MSQGCISRSESVTCFVSSESIACFVSFCLSRCFFACHQMAPPASSLGIAAVPKRESLKLISSGWDRARRVRSPLVGCAEQAVGPTRQRAGEVGCAEQAPTPHACSALLWAVRSTRAVRSRRVGAVRSRRVGLQAHRAPTPHHAAPWSHRWRRQLAGRVDPGSTRGPSTRAACCLAHVEFPREAPRVYDAPPHTRGTFFRTHTHTRRSALYTLGQLPPGRLLHTSASPSLNLHVQSVSLICS